MKRKLPAFLKYCFWDIDFKDLNPQKNTDYTIERILEFGNDRAIKWLQENFHNEEIARLVKTSRRLSPKTANFWRLILDIPQGEVLCISKSYLRKRRKFWPY